ncbi:MAG: hypothetical protein Q9226_002021 [Calogaya cf. arnoldii]
MFDLFTPSKPPSPHARSQSSPYLPTHSKNSNSLATNNHPTDHGSTHSLPQHHPGPQPPALTHPPPYTSPFPADLPPLVTQRLPPTCHTRSNSKLSDWFTGESDPFTFTIVPSPIKEKLDPIAEMTSSLPERTLPAAAKQPLAPKPPMIPRFSLFASKQPSPKAPQTPADVHDAWHDLDVRSALSPTSPPDPFSPSAFKGLQRNAESLLLQLQTAYKQRSQALHDVLAEKETQAEEREGAETRSRHLKLQLENMTAKLAEQDKAMMDLVDQLAQEKSARREAEDAAQTVQATVVQDSRHTRRSSKSRTSTASDMSIESEDSAAESLFSRPGATSPTMSMSSVSTMNSPDSQSLRHPLPTSADHYTRSTSSGNPESRYQAGRNKIFDEKFSSTPIQSSRNVRHDSSPDSEAWSLVNILTLENKGLKARLGQLESTVEDCLDMIKGLF